MVLSLVKRMGGNPEASVIASKLKVPALNAALANGCMGHMAEIDDYHRFSTLHPAAPIIPAALASAEAEQADGKRLLEAVVAGYEVAIRIGEAVNPSHYKFWHTTGTCGTFGAAMAAGKIFQLNAKQMLDALGNAGTQASGLWEFASDAAMSKHLHPAKAAFNGLLAALLAREGFTGATRILEGERGFCRAASESFDLKRLTAGLGRRFKICEVSFKPYASCRHTHPAIEAALTLKAKYGLTARDVVKVRVGTFSTALKIAGNPKPKTPFAAKFSIQYCVAAALVYGRVWLEEFSEQALRNPLMFVGSCGR